MSKFRNFKAEFQLKCAKNWIILEVNPPNRQKLVVLLQTPFRINVWRMCKDPTPIEHF